MEALDIARRHLVESGRPVRHVILLTDGDSNRAAEDHSVVIAALARAQITVTTIRIGADTVNLDLLDAISRATGGEFHHVENVQTLPQLMIRDAQRLMSRAPDRDDRTARIGEPRPHPRRLHRGGSAARRPLGAHAREARRRAETLRRGGRAS